MIFTRLGSILQSIPGAALKRKHRQGELDSHFAEYRATRVEDLRARNNSRPYFINPGQMADSIESWDATEKEQLSVEQCEPLGAKQSVRLSAHQSNDKSQPTTDKDGPEAQLRHCEQLASEAWLAHQAIVRKILDLASKQFSNDPAYGEYSSLVEEEQ